MSSVYIHIPFCKKICSYCDFCKMLYNKEFALDYLIALENEVIEKYNKEEVDTIYIGGGTPSCLNVEELKKLFRTIELFKLSNNYEFTFEINLDDIREELLLLLKDNKVNRLSIGIESFDKNNLLFLNRESNFKDALDKIKLCKKYGFDNISVDLMYAIPAQSIKNLKKDINKFLKLKVPHISTYSLIIENNTKLKIDKTEYIDEDLDYKMYKLINKKLNKKKYIRYEVSNFSKEKYESRHNLVYWNNEEYYGFGLGASGYYQKVRYENTKSLTDYLSKDFTIEKNIISIKDEMDNELMLGFRKTKGISINEFKEKYNKDIFSVYDIDKQIKLKNLRICNGYIKVSDKKMYILNEILLQLL